MDFKIGFGVDIHRLEKGLPLKVGGVEIPSEKGAVGHSDADVLLHAISDSILGALNLRDIGFHFPDTDPKYKGIDSTILLSEICEMIKKESYKISNIDCTVVLEQPKLSSFIPEMQSVISKTLNISSDQISVKATTNEGLGNIGKGEAIKAYATVLLVKIHSRTF